MSRTQLLLITHHSLLITAFRQSYYMLPSLRYVKAVRHSSIAMSL